MGKRFVKQLGQFIVTLFGITFLTFCLTYLAPGDPVTMLLETADTIVSQELIDETRAQLGLDKPFIVQYANWVVNAAQGDLGMSYSAKKPVVDRMLEALPGTVMLAGTPRKRVLGRNPHCHGRTCPGSSKRTDRIKAI